MVAGGSGHVYVWTYCIGNDLSGGNFDATSLKAGYEEMFDYFTDATRFPDGATFLLNTQYNPYDDCRVLGGAGATIPSTVDQRIVDVNRAVFLDVAEARSDTVAIDQLPDFLGHGENANFSGCPYCGADNTTWLGFGPHPNVIGQSHIADKWIALFKSMLAGKCN
jgi:hypothetical protein